MIIKQYLVLVFATMPGLDGFFWESSLYSGAGSAQVVRNPILV